MTDTDLGQPAMAEAPAAPAAPQADPAGYLRHISRLDAEIHTRDVEIGDLKGRLDTLHDKLAQARKGEATVIPAPFGPPWPRSAQQVIDMQQRALNALADRLGAAERRVYELTNPGRYVGATR